MKKTLTLSAVISMIAVSAIAQKLPNIQETSLRAPTTIKVDGKPTEWKSQFQAYNKATEIFYTISNDNDKLYLTVQATDLNIVNKIICAGITLTINGSGKMKDQGGAAITFPMLQIERSHYVQGAPPINLDTPEGYTVDSFTVVLNREITSRLTDIRVTGIKEIPTSLISIYNLEGIKAAALMDNQSRMTYELAIPLKYLGVSGDEQKSISYNIKLPGMNPDKSDGMSFTSAMRAQRRELRNIMSLPKIGGMYAPEGPSAIRLMSVIAPTDFWGEYTVAK
jgi:hypothetical protein